MWYQRLRYERSDVRPDAFDVVAFSIFYAGFGANNAFAFQEAFKQSSLSFECYAGGYPTSAVV